MPVYGDVYRRRRPTLFQFSKDLQRLFRKPGGHLQFLRAFLRQSQYCQGFRAPNIAEISANGVHPGTNIFQLGNPDFKPEFSLQEDIGFVYSSHYVIATLDLFSNTISNYIYNQKISKVDGADSMDNSGNTYFQYTASKAQLYGGEISIDFHPRESPAFREQLFPRRWIE